MPVIAVVNRKGGSGKSTLATHRAAWCAVTGAAPCSATPIPGLVVGLAEAARASPDARGRGSSAGRPTRGA